MAGEHDAIADDRARCSRACGARRASTTRAVRALKSRALRHAFYVVCRQPAGAPAIAATAALRAFEEREGWWLDDYALFRALHDENGGRHWREWDAGLRDRDPSAL